MLSTPDGPDGHQTKPCVGDHGIEINKTKGGSDSSKIHEFLLANLRSIPREMPGWLVCKGCWKKNDALRLEKINDNRVIRIHIYYLEYIYMCDKNTLQSRATQGGGTPEPHR